MVSASTALREPAAPRAQVVVVRGLELLVFVGLPLANAVLFCFFIVRAHGLFDFRTFWQAGHDVLAGRSPYPADLPTHASSATFRPFVYPAPAAVFMAPFAMLPWLVAEGVWMVLGVAAIFVTLWLLEVRDWRCYGAVFMWPALWSSLGNGSVSLILLCACAALWRFRARPYVAGCLLALLVVFKLYLWPLAVWLLVTRRVRATVVSIGAAAAAAVVGWAMIGFAGLREYPSLLGRLSTLVGGESYSPYAFAKSLGAGAGGARLAMLACGALVLLGVFVYARRGRDETAFIMGIGATFVLSPIVWPHYFVLLVVAVAVVSPELDAGWLLPIGAWYATTAWSDGHPIKIGLALVVYGLTFVWAVRRSTGSARRSGLIAPSLLRPAVK
jgi:hypothetical protein